MTYQRYSDKELGIFLWVVTPYVAIFNFILFAECLFSSLSGFFLSFALTMAYLFVAYFVFGLVAVFIQKKFPSDHDLFRRIGMMLPIFYFMNFFLAMGGYAYYSLINFYQCAPRAGNFWGLVVFCCLASTVIAFLNEAVANWKKWKLAITETEQLKNAYQKSKLFGLKGQINPHFLFNCFNSLSSLISEDEIKAERFLNEMTKVHRYMLRNDDEQLVTFSEELKFTRSYLYLIDTRFGPAIQTYIDVEESLMDMFLPPLSLQVILENIIYANVASKSSPLYLSITGEGNNLLIRNTVQGKIRKEEDKFEEGLDNLVTKYKLMRVPEIAVQETAFERIIVLPLLAKNQEFS